MGESEWVGEMFSLSLAALEGVLELISSAPVLGGLGLLMAFVGEYEDSFTPSSHVWMSDVDASATTSGRVG